MTLSRIAFLAPPILALACSGASESRPGSDAGPADAVVLDAPLLDALLLDSRAEGESGGPIPLDANSPDALLDANSPDTGASTNNVAPMVVNAGPPQTGSFDVAFVSITVCVPGTMNCQAVDYVSVDTGASGIRVVSGALPASLDLPQQTAPDGEALGECLTYDDGYVWGPVKLADIRIGGELAASVPIQVFGDPTFSAVPDACSSTGPSENTVVSFGGNGTIGINPIVPDEGDYYGCSGSSCTAVTVSNADQAPNPIARFETDNNGSVLQFPSIPAVGAPTVTGSLIFGIGTEANNELGGATVLTVDGNGNFTTVFDGNTLDQSYFDSGTNYLSFADSSIPRCSASSTAGRAFFCPGTTLSLTANNVGMNGMSAAASFSIANANSLFANASYTAFSDLGGPGGGTVTFDWGLPFFMGRSIFVALDGAATTGGTGPYFAY